MKASGEGGAGRPWNPDFSRDNPLLAHLAIPRFEHWPDGSDYARAFQGLRNENGCEIRFSAPLDRDYETRIFETGEVSTRPCNWHDFFNAVVWLNFPHAKAKLNAMHCREGCSRRNAVRDALTHFDESGVVVLFSARDLAEDLIDFKWQSLFVDKRERILKEMRFLIFGHGLLEKAMNPYVGMTGKGIAIETRDLEIGRAELDRRLAESIDRLEKPSDLFPVPLLGYPGWDENNADPAYYRNESYFRKGRSMRP